MALYYSTFISGLLKPVREALQRALPQCQVRLGLDGLIVYESNATSAELQRLPFVTNTFSIIKSFPQNTKRNIGDMAQLLIKDRSLNFTVPSVAGRRVGTFRVITSLANQLVPINQKVMQLLEDRIQQQTGARSHRAKPDTELWLLQRSEGYGFFSVRLSRHKSFDKVLEKGELRPDLAYLLCQLSQPKAGELFLDPFCGSGAIPLQRALFPTGLIIASDLDCGKIERLKERVREQGLKKKIVVRCENAMHLERYEDGSIHVIVTDPPWGHFESLNMPVQDFYQKMVTEFVRLLPSRGRLVVLTGQTDVFTACIHSLSRSLTLVETHDILVSGKKASVYVAARV